MAESFHYQVKRLVIPANKQDAYVYSFDSIGMQRDPSKQHEGVWNAKPAGLVQYPLRTSPVKVWLFLYDHLNNTDVLDGVLDNNPNQGVFGYCCQNPKDAKPEEMVFFLPGHKLPDSYKPGGIWVHPNFKLENLKELDDEKAGFMVMGDNMEKNDRLGVGGAWQMMGHNQKVKQPKNKPDLGGRQKKEPFGVKVRQKSKGVIFPVELPSSKTKVDKLKDKIYTEKSIPSEEQRLAFEGTPLEDNKALTDFGIKNGDIIDLEPMEVYVKNPKGKKFLFQVEPDEPVEELMEKVEEKEGTPIEQQILSFYRKKLEPTKTLNLYRIKHKDVIDLAVGPPVNKTRVFVEVPEDPNSLDDTKTKKIEINVPPGATFGHVKKLIEDETGVPKSKQRVFFQDKEMKDKKPIAKAKLGEGDTLRMEPVPEPEVEVKMPDGTSRQFFFDPDEPVKDFKERLKTDFPSGTKLTFDDREMLDEDPMGKYNPKKGDVLLAEPAGVHVDTPTGVVDVSGLPIFTPDNIKDVIEEQTGLPKAQQRLFYFDEELVDGDKPIDKEKLQSMGTKGLKIEPEPVEVQITLPNGQSRAFFMDPAETVEDFKEKYNKDFPSGTRLMFNDEELVDEEPLGKYNLKKGDVLIAEPDGIAVETPRGKVVLNADAAMLTPSDIKDVIEEKTGVPKSQQRLFYFDEELVDDDKPLGKAKLMSLQAAPGLKMEPLPAEVEITMPNGKPRKFFMDPADTVQDFKEKNKKDFPPFTKLMFNDVKLVDEEPLGKYNLKKGDVLTAEPEECAVLETQRGKVMLSLETPMLTPSDIKDVIEEQTGVPKAQQRLFFFDEELVDDKKPLDKAKLRSLLETPGLRLEELPPKVQIAMPNGKTRTFVIDPDETVGDFKEKHSKLFPPGTKLMFDDVELVDEEPFDKYNLRTGDVLTAEPDDCVVIETPRGKVVLRLSPKLTPSDIKDVIKQQTGVPKSQQRLFYFDDELPATDDKKPLGKAKLKKLLGTHGLRMEPIPAAVEIAMPNGKTRMFIMDPDETVGDFKKKHKAHLPPGTKLMFRDMELVDEEPLGKYNLKNGNVLTAEPEDGVAIDTPRGKVMLSQGLPMLTPSEIKDILEEQTGVPKSRQRIFYLDEELVDDDKPLDISKFQSLGPNAVRMDLVPEGDPEDPELAKSRDARAFYQDAEEMEIVLPNGKKIKLSVLPTMTMKDLKQIVEEEVPEMKTNKQRMFTFDAADEIDDDTPLSKLKFDSGHPLELRPMQVSVKHWNGKTFDLPIAPSDYIDDVKEMLEDLTGVESAYLRLSHEGTQVDDTLRLDEQGIVDGSVLVLEQMRIFVKVPDGRSIRLRAEPKDTIKLIKKKIAKKTGQHHAKQSILLAGEDLDDKVTLAACGIESGDELTMEKFRIDIMDDSDGTVVTLADVARGDTVGLVRRQVLKEFKRRVDRDQLYWQQIESALDDSSSLGELGIPHKSILVIRVPEEKSEEYKADRLRFKELAAKKFGDVDEDLIMPVKPDFRTRTFIFDNDSSPVDGFITVNVVYWSGKTYKFDDLRPKETVKALMKRIKKRRKCPAFNLLLNGKILEESGRLLDLGVGHKSFLVMDQKKKKSIDELPQVDKVNLDTLKSRTAGKITVQIKMWNGKLLELEIGGTEYVDDIRDQLCDRLSIPAEYQLLSRSGEEVDDTLTLNEQNIKDGSLLVLEPLEVQINLPFKSTLMLKVEPEDTIAFIKRKIEKRNSYSAKVQCLVFQGRVLEDSDTIMDCNIQHEDELDLELFVINILQLDGGRFTVSGSIHPGSTIGEVQRIIAKKQLVPVQLQQLRLHEKELDPSVKLSRQGVGHKSLLILEVLSRAKVQKEAKKEKIQLEVPAAPPSAPRRMSNPELESPAIRVRKEAPRNKAPTRNKSVDTENDNVERIAEAARTKRVMRKQKEEKKKVRLSKALNPVKETNRGQAMDDSFGSPDFANATDTSEPVLRARKGRAGLSSGGAKVRARKTGNDGWSNPMKQRAKSPKRSTSPMRDKSPAREKSPVRGKSPMRTKSPKRSATPTADDEKKSTGAKTREELSQMTIRQLKDLNLSLGGDANQHFVEKSDLVDQVYQLSQANKRGRKPGGRGMRSKSPAGGRSAGDKAKEGPQVETSSPKKEKDAKKKGKGGLFKKFF